MTPKKQLAMSRPRTTKALQLIVGLGNPGPTYADTRHNVGQVWVESLATAHNIVLREDAKYFGWVGRGEIHGVELRLLVPTTFMNLSGDAVAALAGFFKLDSEEILVAHDELAFEPGQVKLKSGGGTNGHNGLKDIIPKLGNNDRFHRLRIGVGHPGAPDKVASYLTSSRVPEKERDKIELALNFKPDVVKALVSGDISRAMNAINTKPPKKKKPKEADATQGDSAQSPKNDNQDA